MSLKNITLWEPRAVRVSSGGYGGPSIRIAKGVYWRMGAFRSTSESHEELKPIDGGTLALTNNRLVFVGGKRTVNTDLRKVASIEPYKDGVAVRSSSRQKPQYYVGMDKLGISFAVKVADRAYQEPFGGPVFAFIMEGLTKQSE